MVQFEAEGSNAWWRMMWGHWAAWPLMEKCIWRGMEPKIRRNPTYVKLGFFV